MQSSGIPLTPPISPQTLVRFISHLSQIGRATSTIKTATAAIATIHNLLFDHDPSKSFLVARSLKGLEKVTRERAELLPISRELLSALLKRMDHLDIPSYDRIAAKALFALAYMGCFRIGELVLSSSSKHTAALQNFVIHKSEAGKELRIHLPSFKHNSSPALIKISESNSDFCAIHLLEKYLSIRPPFPGHLFINRQGIPYNRVQVAHLLKRSLRSLVPSTRRYNTHSFRIGRTTDLVKEGNQESIIQQVGRWKSLAYRKYFRVQAFQMPK